MGGAEAGALERLGPGHRRRFGKQSRLPPSPFSLPAQTFTEGRCAVLVSPFTQAHTYSVALASK